MMLEKVKIKGDQRNRFKAKLSWITNKPGVWEVLTTNGTLIGNQARGQPPYIRSEVGTRTILYTTGTNPGYQFKSQTPRFMGKDETVTVLESTRDRVQLMCPIFL